MTDLEWRDASASHAQALIEGDIVLIGPNGALAYEIVAVRGQKAWIRDLDDGRDGVVDLTSFRRRGLGAKVIFQ